MKLGKLLLWPDEQLVASFISMQQSSSWEET